MFPIVSNTDQLKLLLLLYNFNDSLNRIELVNAVELNTQLPRPTLCFRFSPLIFFYYAGK